MPKVKVREFFYTVWTNTGNWGGSSEYSGFIRATSPKNAVCGVWNKYGLSGQTYADRFVHIYDGAAYRKKMPEFPPELAKRSESGDGSRSGCCGNPDCSYCGG